ncbi:uncharacterized protein [Watersipora subatra]|uniref:uncharacterized protein n=1 Tax=Watersipora subatra TaxID=2589382 RepID=UPI00355C22B8
MTSILKKVLSLDERAHRGTDHYIDDIVVQESVLNAQGLRDHLARYELETKEPEALNGGRLLGVALQKDSSGHLKMSRGTALSEYNFELGAWDSPVGKTVGSLAGELLARARREDPVKGVWRVNPRDSVTVWTDASSLGMSVALEVNGNIVEDASWLRKESDHQHINVAELEADGRRINFAIAWGFKTFTLAIDSLTVVNWWTNTMDERNRVRTKGVAEMLVKRRLGVIRDTIAKYGLAVSVHFVPSVEDKADRMTRVSRRWLEYREADCEAAEVSAAIVSGESPEDAIWAAHLPHHLGVDRTLYLARHIRKDLSRKQVKTNLAGCEACQRIDPALRGESIVAVGDLAVEENWCRVAIDVTHYGDSSFLSMVDCGSSRFAIWCRLQTESAAQIMTQLCSTMVECGPCYELLLDNSAAFRSAAVHQFANRWGISLRFRAAYAPGDNGIVERTHRTIKRIAERGGITPEEATFWYNVTPWKEIEETSVSSNVLFRYQWRMPFDINSKTSEEDVESCFSVGGEVWV